MEVDMELARKAIREKICAHSNLDEEQAANGIVTIVNSNMVRAVRSVSVEKGYDVRESADFSHYQDAANVSPFAGKAMSWAVAEGLINGVTADQLQPQGNATRAWKMRDEQIVLVCQTYVTHYAESFLESPLEISNPVVSSGSYCISCCESSTALKNLRNSRICV